MKSEKGLSFIATIFLVIIIAITMFAVVYFFRIQTGKEKAEDIKTDMLLVQAKVKKISGDYTLEKKEEVLVGTKLSEMEDNKEIKDFLEKDTFDPDEENKKYFVLTQENLNDLELNKVILEDGAYYIVEYTDSSVYYTKGFMDENGDIHYKAKEIVESEEKGNQEEKNEEATNQESDEEEEPNKEK